MAGLLRAATITDAERARNDGAARIGVVTAVVGAALVFAYLFANLAELAHLPSPRAVAAHFGLEAPGLFDRSGALECHLAITLTNRLHSGALERLVLFGAALAAFLASYFAPLAYKRPSLVGLSVATLALLYGPTATGGLLLAHLVLYLSLHPRAAGASAAKTAAALIAGGLLAETWPVSHGYAIAGASAGVAALALPSSERDVALRWPRLVGVARLFAVQSAIIVTGIAALAEAASGRTWTLPLGLLLFFWQWERIILYHVDWKDGRVPADLDPATYLSVFLSPGAIANFNWGVTIGQGYAYTSGAQLAEDKNKLVVSGLGLWGRALAYLLLADPLRIALDRGFTSVGIPVHGCRTSALVAHFAAGGSVSTASVLLTTLLDLVRWLMLWGGVVHFKVGLWRIVGYRVDPYFDKPWLATNLVSFWARFTYHYREFLVRAFYYPTFFRFFKRHKRTRIFVATLAAAGVGNLIWGHVTEGLFYKGLRFESVIAVLRTWPYFALLGVAIALTELYLVGRRRTRKPWAFGPRIVLDVLAAYATVQFYALITIFARPAPNSTLGSLGRLALVGLGIHL